jgi:hypothetical protein
VNYRQKASKWSTEENITNVGKLTCQQDVQPEIGKTTRIMPQKLNVHQSSLSVYISPCFKTHQREHCQKLYHHLPPKTAKNFLTNERKTFLPDLHIPINNQNDRVWVAGKMCDV